MARWFVDRCPQRGIPSVSLRRLLPEADFGGCSDLVVSGASRDSRRLEPGQVFVAIPGHRADGHDFIPQAIARGAVGILAERPCPGVDALQILVPDARSAHARLCQALAGSPADRLRVVGIAGTHGRRTVATFLAAILDAAGETHGAVTPGGWSDGRELFHAGHATPGPEAIAEMLAAAVDRHAGTVVLTASADAIERRGLDGVRFETLVVSHLGGDHDVEEVRRRRRLAAKLARQVRPGTGLVLPADDGEAAPLAGSNLDVDALTFGLSASSDIGVTVDRLGPLGSLLRIRTPGRELRVGLRLVGTWNVRYALAAVGAALTLKIDPEAIVAGLEAVERVPGCLDRIDRGQEFEVRIDRARKASSLRRTLETIREIRPGATVHCVVGATAGMGQADRLTLARAAEAAADRLYLTADEAEAESPAEVLASLAAGLKKPNRATLQADRREAIEAALAAAGPGDVVLVAGKGRDRSLVLASGGRKPLDDAAIVEDWIDRDRTGTHRRSA